MEILEVNVYVYRLVITWSIIWVSCHSKHSSCHHFSIDPLTTVSYIHQFYISLCDQHLVVRHSAILAIISPAPCNIDKKVFRANSTSRILKKEDDKVQFPDLMHSAIITSIFHAQHIWTQKVSRRHENLLWIAHKLSATKIEHSHWLTGHSTNQLSAEKVKWIYKLSCLLFNARRNPKEILIPSFLKEKCMCMNKSRLNFCVDEFPSNFVSCWWITGA